MRMQPANLTPLNWSACWSRWICCLVVRQASITRTAASAMAAMAAAAGAVSTGGQSSNTASKSRRNEPSQLPSDGASVGDWKNSTGAPAVPGQRDTLGTRPGRQTVASGTWLMRSNEATWTMTTRWPEAASSAAIPLQASGPRDPEPLSTTATTEWLWKRLRMRSRYSPELGTASNSAGALEAAFSRIRAFLLIYAPTGGIYPSRRRRRPAGLRPRRAMRGGRIERFARRLEGLGEDTCGAREQASMARLRRLAIGPQVAN